MASTNLRSHLCFPRVMLTLLLGLAASCKNSADEKVDAGQRKYCLDTDARADRPSGDGLGDGVLTDTAEVGGGISDVAIDTTFLPDASSLRLDSGATDVAEVRGDSMADSGSLGLPDGQIDTSSSGGGGASGSTGSTGTGGTARGGATAGTTGSGGAGGSMVDASPNIPPDSGIDVRDAVLVDAIVPTDVRDAALVDTTDLPVSDVMQSEVVAPDASVDSPIDSPIDVQPEVPPSTDVVLADLANDVPASVCLANSASLAKKWPLLGGMGVGADGTLWAAGKFYTPFDFASDMQDGGTGLTSTGSADIYLTKLAPATGLALAQFSFGAFNDDSDPARQKVQMATGLAVASGNNVGLIGKFDYEIDFGPDNQDGTGPSGNVGTAGKDFLIGSGKNTPFYAVIDGASSGTYATTKKAHMIDVGSGSILSIGSNSSQDFLAICGKTSKAVPLWNTNGATKGVITGTAAVAGGGMDIVVAKINASTGDVLWGKQFGGAGDQVCQSATLDSDGNVIIAGNYNGMLNFGSGASLPDVVTASNQPDTTKAILYVTKLNADTGEAIAAQHWGGTGLSDAFAITLDASNNIIVAGRIGGDINFGAGSAIVDLGATDAFVAKLTSSLATVWAKSFGDALFDQQVKSVATSSSGDVFIGGDFTGGLGALNLTSSSNTAPDGFLAQLTSANGSVVCARSYGDALGSQSVDAVTVSRTASGSLADWTAIGGTFQNSITLGNTTLNTANATTSAGFFARIAP
jgi:hypothetical protein